MTASLLKDGFPSAHRTTRQRIESSIDLRRLFFAIDTDPGLIGAGVVYIDEAFNVVILREFQAVCSVVAKKKCAHVTTNAHQGREQTWPSICF